MTPAGAPSGNAVVLERIEGLRCDIAEIKATTNQHMAEDRKAREAYLVEHSNVVQKADAAHRRLDVIEPIVMELQRSVQTNNNQLEALNAKMAALIKIVVFIGTGIGAWLLGQILGLIR